MRIKDKTDSSKEQREGNVRKTSWEVGKINY
jgi:hypothetical protein